MILPFPPRLIISFVSNRDHYPKIDFLRWMIKKNLKNLIYPKTSKKKRKIYIYIVLHAEGNIGSDLSY